MTAYVYRDGEMAVEGVPLAKIAREVGTPAYVYSAAMLREAYRGFADAAGGMDCDIHYAVKANSNLAIIKLFARMGAGADIVSLGEMRRALAAGVPAGHIVFSGVGKKPSELAAALEAGVRQINVESAPELETLNAIAAQLKIRAKVAIRINPDVDAGTHAKITTGKKGNKFGIDIDLAPDAYRLAAKLSHIDPVGVAMHIGSQITTLEPHRAAIRRMRALVQELRKEGIALSRFDVGGGFGIVYKDEQPEPAANVMAMIREETSGLNCSVSIEPGRRLVGEAGVLLAEVVLIKEGADRRFVIVDAAMNDLIRPTLYEAWHGIDPVRQPVSGAKLENCDVVGPICESGDYLALGRALPPLAAGEFIVIRSAGAYGAVMGSTYNSRPLAPEVLVDGDRYAVIRPRQRIEDLLGAERIPEWL